MENLEKWGPVAGPLVSRSGFFRTGTIYRFMALCLILFKNHETGRDCALLE